MTVLEVARISVRAGAEEAFERAFLSAQAYVRGAEGHLDSVLTRTLDSERQYAFLVRWNSLADHVERFAASPEFALFGTLISPYLESEPDVRHFEELDA